MRTFLLPIALAAGVAAAGCVGMEGGTLGEPSPTPSPTPTPLTEETGFPCDVRAVLETNCAPCHGGNMVYYATTLTTRDIWLAPHGDGMSFGQYAAKQVADGKMPPPAAETQPSSTDRALLIAWVAAGMPAGACEPLTPPPR